MHTYPEQFDAAHLTPGMAGYQSLERAMNMHDDAEHRLQEDTSLSQSEREALRWQADTLEELRQIRELIPASVIAARVQEYRRSGNPRADLID